MPPPAFDGAPTHACIWWVRPKRIWWRGAGCKTSEAVQAELESLAEWIGLADIQQ